MINREGVVDEVMLARRKRQRERARAERERIARLIEASSLGPAAAEKFHRRASREGDVVAGRRSDV